VPTQPFKGCDPLTTIIGRTIIAAYRTLFAKLLSPTILSSSVH